MELIPLSPEPEDSEAPLPKYSDKGRVLFRYWRVCNEKPEVEVLDYDGESSIMWLNESVGINYAITDILPIDIELDGVYVIEGIHGQYFRGDGWTTDDDEEWYFDFIRRASPSEESSEALDDNSNT